MGAISGVISWRVGPPSVARPHCCGPSLKVASLGTCRRLIHHILFASPRSEQTLFNCVWITSCVGAIGLAYARYRTLPNVTVSAEIRGLRSNLYRGVIDPLYMLRRFSSGCSIGKPALAAGPSAWTHSSKQVTSSANCHRAYNDSSETY